MQIQDLQDIHIGISGDAVDLVALVRLNLEVLQSQ